LHLTKSGNLPVFEFPDIPHESMAQVYLKNRTNRTNVLLF